MSNWQSGGHHFPSNVAGDNPITSLDRPLRTTHHFTISHGENDSASIFEGNLDPNGVQSAPVGSIYMRNFDESPANGRLTHFMKRGNEGTSSDFEVIQERIVYNVKEFGAKGDNLQDDSDAIIRAWEAMLSRQTPYTTQHLYFPPGKYIVTKPVITGACFGAILTGPNATIIRNDSDCSIIDIQANYLTVRTLHFSCPSATNGTSIKISGSSALIDNVVVSGFNGVFLDGNSHIITNSTINATKNYAVMLQGYNSTVKTCIMSNSDTTSKSASSLAQTAGNGGHCILLGDPSSDVPLARGVVVSENRLTSNKTTIQAFGSLSDINICNNLVLNEDTEASIYMQDPISGYGAIFITNNSSRRIEAYQISSMVIQGNVLIGTACAIACDKTNRATINANSIIRSGASTVQTILLGDDCVASQVNANTITCNVETTAVPIHVGTGQDVVVVGNLITSQFTSPVVVNSTGRVVVANNSN